MMLLSGEKNDPVWMVIDDDVVPGRLVSIEPAADSPTGHRVNVAYSDRPSLVRSCFPTSVFKDSEHKLAVKGITC